MKELVAPPESVFRRIVQDATDFSILLLDEDGHIVMWNAGAEAIFGYTAEEIIGRSFDILFMTEDRERGIPAKELKTARTEGRADDTRWHIGKDGRWRFMDGVTTPFRSDDGRILGFSKFGRDITDRQRTERRLAAQLALTNLLNEERPFAETARAILQTICENLGWLIGSLWQIKDGSMQCVEQWQAPHIDRAGARQLCDSLRFERGTGIIGRVWESGYTLSLHDALPDRKASCRERVYGGQA